MEHYTKEDLELYRHNEMSVLGRITCASHLKICPKCEKLLRELEDEDRFVADLRKSVKIYKDLAKKTPARPRRTASGV